MKKNIILNKYYKKLRNNIFKDLDIYDFMEVYTKFRRLKLQYKFLQIANFLEQVNIPTLEIPIFRFFC